MPAAVKLEQLAVSAGQALVGVQASYRRFWVVFAGALAAEQHDLPFDRIEGWRRQPEFITRVERLLAAGRGADARLVSWMSARVTALPRSSRYTHTEAMGRMREIASWAAVTAMEDRRHPAALAHEQAALLRSDLDEIKTALERVSAPPGDLAAAERREHAAAAREDTAETARTRLMLAEVLATLAAAGLGGVRLPDDGPGRVTSDSPDGTVGLGGSRRVRERAADKVALLLAAMPDVAQVLLLDQASTVLIVADRPVYADLAVTDTGGRRWLTECKVQLGARAARSARWSATAALIDQAGSPVRWASVTRAEAERVGRWAELTGDPAVTRRRPSPG